MLHIVTTQNMDVALAWAETIPYQNDFTIVAHLTQDFKAYTITELLTLHRNICPEVELDEELTHSSLVQRIIRLLDRQITTSELPPDVKRVAPLPSLYEEIKMNTSKKTAAKKTATKKTAPKKTAVPKVERTSKNDVLTPKPESQTGKVFAICDKLSKKAGKPAERSAVVAASEKAGIKTGTATAAYQIWRKYNGLVKSGK